ncbi:MAG TPA: glycosyltransferase family 2 protein [Gaiellaceae bacterium]|nr:glycosyltransferase family 2 protein [Gaiellaceae bacterium]
MKALFWTSLGGLAWTHVGYPVAAAALRKVRSRPVRRAEIEPTVSMIVPAHDEDEVIEQRVQNLLELDYPVDKLEIVIASDASTDRTDEIVERFAAEHEHVRLLRCERGGKLPALNRAVRDTESELVAFGDANATWAPSALRTLVRNFADPDVAYVCGQVRFQRRDGTNREGLYWRYEMWLRESESALGSITGGNGAIYAVRRSDYVEWPFGHDQGFPNLMVQKGRRAVYEPEAIAFEKPSRDNEDEFRRKVRMLPWSWRHLFEAGGLRRVPPLYLAELISHRVLRYASGFLHVALLATSVALIDDGRVYEAVLAAQALWLALAAAGKLKLRVPGAGIAWYYLLMSVATMVALVRYLRDGTQLMWEKAEGTR